MLTSGEMKENLHSIEREATRKIRISDRMSDRKERDLSGEISSGQREFLSKRGRLVN